VAQQEQLAKKKTEESGPRRALLFELENLAVDGHHLVYEAVRTVLKDRSIELTPGIFSRYCVCRPPRIFAPILLKNAGKERVSADKLCSEMTAAISEAFKNRSHKINSSLKGLMIAAAERNVLLGALSRLDGAASEQLAEHLELGSLGVRTLAQTRESQASGSGGEGWAALCRMLLVRPGRCVVLVTSASSARAAQAARLRCVAIPSGFTAFQDFGGADCVLPSIEDVRIDELIALMESK
jgi:beta-phosphoglucomutase-like phosphatase (HAD superfamily)